MSVLPAGEGYYLPYVRDTYPLGCEVGLRKGDGMTVPHRERHRRMWRKSTPLGVAYTLFFVIAVIVSVSVIFTKNDILMRCGLILALWAALGWAFVANQSRRKADLVTAKASDYKLIYDLQLEREIAARHHYELSLENELRKEISGEAERSTNAMLTELQEQILILRGQLQEFLDQDFDYDQPALKARATRLDELLVARKSLGTDDAWPHKRAAANQVRGDERESEEKDFAGEAPATSRLWLPSQAERQRREQEWAPTEKEQKKGEKDAFFSEVKSGWPRTSAYSPQEEYLQGEEIVASDGKRKRETAPSSPTTQLNIDPDQRHTLAWTPEAVGKNDGSQAIKTPLSNDIEERESHDAFPRQEEPVISDLGNEQIADYPAWYSEAGTPQQLNEMEQKGEAEASPEKNSSIEEPQEPEAKSESPIPFETPLISEEPQGSELQQSADTPTTYEATELSSTTESVFPGFYNPVRPKPEPAVQTFHESHSWANVSTEGNRRDSSFEEAPISQEQAPLLEKQAPVFQSDDHSNLTPETDNSMRPSAEEMRAVASDSQGSESAYSATSVTTAEELFNEKPGRRTHVGYTGNKLRNTEAKDGRRVKNSTQDTAIPEAPAPVPDTSAPLPETSAPVPESSSIESTRGESESAIQPGYSSGSHRAGHSVSELVSRMKSEEPDGYHGKRRRAPRIGGHAKDDDTE